MVHGAAGDDGENLIAVAAGVAETLEHQHSAALRAGVAVGVGTERLDPAVRCRTPPTSSKPMVTAWSDQSVDAAGHHHVRFARAQRLNTLMHGYQR